MNVLIRQVRVYDPQSPFHQQTVDILIDSGKIREVAPAIAQAADKVIEIPGLWASPGWVDSFSHFCDPGLEQKETLQSGTSAAAAGGFTHVMVVPNTVPVIQSKAQVDYLQSLNHLQPVQVHPIGCITRNAEGKELADIYEMHSAGAVAFSDGTAPIQSSGLLIKALQYVKAINRVVIQIPDDTSIGGQGLINEGIVSTQLGLPGKPAMAEEIMVARDIKLARYADSRLHFTGVSSAKSLEYVKRAKEGGIDVSCSVTPYHLWFTENELREYDTNLKVYPPVRTNQDKEALLNALKAGVIDCIAVHHFPQEWDRKTCEFEYAKAGMIGLESAFGAVLGAGLDLDTWYNIACANPRKIFGFAQAGIKPGMEADITLFLPDVTYTFEESHIKSKSRNSAFIGKPMKGKVAGVIFGNNFTLNQN